MRFRPCIDIHNGKVKQIVGSSLNDQGDQAKENFVSSKDAAYYADLYKSRALQGGHVILLNAPGSEYYERTKAQAISALRRTPGLLQAGGGIRPENALQFLDAGASQVIVTSYVFRDGSINRENLARISETVGKDRLVLDLSCRSYQGELRIATDRWQKISDECLSRELIAELAPFCSELLVHAVDAEGKQNGPVREVLRLLGDVDEIPCVYAGGIHCMEDIETIREMGQGRVDFTVGSALDLFGGSLSFDVLAGYH